VGGPAAEVPGEAAGEGSGARAGGSGAPAGGWGAPATGAGGDAEAAGGGEPDPAAPAGAGVRAACRKHAERHVSKATTIVVRRYDTRLSASINRANSTWRTRC